MQTVGFWGESVKYGIALLFLGLMICLIHQEKLLKKLRRNVISAVKALRNMKEIPSRSFWRQGSFAAKNASGNLNKEIEEMPSHSTFKSLELLGENKNLKCWRNAKVNMTLQLKLDQYVILLLSRGRKFPSLKLNVANLDFPRPKGKLRICWATNTILLGLPSTSLNGTDPTADMPALHTHSSDLLEFEVHALFRWSYNPKALIQLYENYQDMEIIKNQVVASIVRTCIENHLPDWSALDIVTNRPQIALELGEIIKQEVMNTSSINYAIIPESMEFNLRDVTAPDSWYEAIERKLNSEQDIITAMNNKQISIINSEALAQQAIIQAQGDANATIIRFQGIADAINQLAISTGANASDLALLQTYLQGLQAIADTEGQSYFFIGFNGDVPFIIPIEPQP